MRKVKGSPARFQANHQPSNSRDERPKADEGMTFAKEVKSVNEMESMILDSMRVTIETLKKQNLTSGEISFTFMGANVACKIQVPRWNS